MEFKNGIISCHLMAFDQRLEELLGKSEPIFLRFSFKLSSLVAIREITANEDSDEADPTKCTLVFGDTQVSVDIPYLELFQLWTDKINYL